MIQRHRALLSSVVAAALAVASIAAPAAAAPGIRASLSGANEVPPADPDGSGSVTVKINTGKGLVCYELWRAEKAVEPGTFAPEVTVAFDLPDDPELANRLDGTNVRYWELAVDAEAPGVDFSTTFVLPVYREPATAMTAPTA